VADKKEFALFVLGAVLLIIGIVAKIPILWMIGVVLLAFGAGLFLLGSSGRTVGGRRHYY
jgi:hypothetical protein